MDTTKVFNFNFGTKPTTTKQEEIVVDLDTATMIDDYAKAFVNELRRRNPIRANEVDLTYEEMVYYLSGLMRIRVESLAKACKAWREAKSLWIPCFYEFVITQVGIVVDVDKGLKITPHFEFDYDIQKLMDISGKLRLFKNDGVSLVKDAFPREDEGDAETMTMCIVNDYIMSMSKDSHPIAAYVAAFIGAKLREEATFKLLYRVRYDDVSFIRCMLLGEETLYGSSTV